MQTRQGSIPIDFDEDAAIELYDWNVLAISSRDAVESDVETLRSQRDQQQRKLEELEKHLSEIIEAKKRHEDELLEKFRHLLNAKKSKIRDQMRLLATVKVDTATGKCQMHLFLLLQLTRYQQKVFDQVEVTVPQDQLSTTARRGRGNWNGGAMLMKTRTWTENQSLRWPMRTQIRIQTLDVLQSLRPKMKQMLIRAWRRLLRSHRSRAMSKQSRKVSEEVDQVELSL